MWNIVFFHTRDLRHCRTSPECELELPERLIGAFSQHFDGAVGQVLGPASQPEPVCRLPDEPSEPHTLHPAVNDEPRRGHGSVLPPSPPPSPPPPPPPLPPPAPPPPPPRRRAQGAHPPGEQHPPPRAAAGRLRAGRAGAGP